MSIVGNTIGAILKNPETIILRLEDGTEHPLVMTGEEVVLTATPNDVRQGKTVVLTEGVATGEKEIPSYHTNEGIKIVPAGSSFVMYLSKYCDYTKLQAIFCPFNTTLDDSVAAERVAISDNVYPVNSTVAESKITKDVDSGEIIFGFVNTTTIPYLIRYFTYKEEY